MEGIAGMKGIKGIRAGFDSASPSLVAEIGYLCYRLARYPFYRVYRLNPCSLRSAILFIPFVPSPIGAAA